MVRDTTTVANSNHGMVAELNLAPIQISRNVSAVKTSAVGYTRATFVRTWQPRRPEAGRLARFGLTPILVNLPCGLHLGSDFSNLDTKIN